MPHSQLSTKISNNSDASSITLADGHVVNANVRVAMWKMALEGWTHYPIFGVGIGGIPNTIAKNIDITLAQAYTGCMMPFEIERWVQQGELRITEIETITLNIPAGADSGISLVIKGKGNAYSEAVRGDVKITINVTNDTPFQRKGNDLYYKKQITLKEALCGFQFQFVHLNGKTMSLNNTSTVIFSGARKNINGLGMTAAGNLVVEFDVVFPTELSALQREALDNIL